MPHHPSLRVFSALRLALAVAPGILFGQLNITRQPDRLVTVQSGQPAILSVGVTATPAPTYQWRRYGRAIPGATQPSYQIPAVSQFDNDFYDVLITSGSTTAVSDTTRLLVTLPSYPQAVVVDLPRSLLLEGAEFAPAGPGPAFIHAVLPDGRFYIGGGFSTVDGQARRDLVRFNANGTLDSTFTAPEFDSRPDALALQPDGKLLLAGAFRRVGGAAVPGLVRLNADGTRDPSFTPAIGFATPVAGSVHVAADGNIYLSGSGIAVTGGFYGYIARLLPSGALDPTFSSPTFSQGTGSTNPNGFLFGPSGEIYVYGTFERVNGITRPRIARLLSNGTVDVAFDPGTGPNSFVYAITVLGNGQLVIGGDFTSYNGTPVGRIARLTTTGALDSSFATGSGFGNQVGWLAELPGNGLFVGSTGGSYNGGFVGPGVRLNANGTVDASFTYSLNGRPDSLTVLPGNRLLVSSAFIADGRPGVHVLEPTGASSTIITLPALRFPARARVLAPLPGGKILVGGDFSHVNGAPAPFLMRLNADLSRDPGFPAGPGPTSSVIRSIVQPDGKIVLFTYDSIIRLNANGSNDVTFASASPRGFWFAVPPVLLSDGRFFVPTDSVFWGGAPVANGLVILESDGTRASSHPFAPGPNPGSRITGVQRLPGGRLLVTGTFTTWNGLGRNNAVRLHADGAVDPTFAPDGSVQFANFTNGMAVNSWSIQRDGRLIVSTEREPNQAVTRVNLDGTRDRTFVSGLPPLFSGAGLFVQPDDRIIVIAQGMPLSTPQSFELPNVITRLTPNGGVDASFVVRGSGLWQEMMLADNGELLSSDSSGYLHRYKALPAPTISTPPAPQSIVAGTTILLRVAATGEGPLTYQWFKDGVIVPGAASAALTLDSASTSAAGFYTVAVTNAGGTATSPAALVSIAARPLAGAYFGTIGGSAGGFALYLRENGTGAFLGYLRDTRTLLTARNVSVGSDRRFRFAATANVGGGAPVSTEIEGVIATEGRVSGTAWGLALAAPAATTSGATSAQAGFYETAEPGTSGVGYTVVGPNGTGYTAVLARTLVDAGIFTVDATGTLAGTLEAGTRFNGGISNNGLVAATLISTGGTSITFSGGDNDKRSDVEKLVNISTRSVVRTGGSFTVGFVVVGDRTKPVLVRAIGPTLGAFVDGALLAARLEVFRETNSIASGNDWGSAPNAAAISATAARVGAFALPSSSRDAALLLELEPGNYSARVTGQGDSAGVALVEVYDGTEGTIPLSQRIINVSTLAEAGTGDSTLTAGFYVAGTVPKRLLIRGAGPGLEQFGVTGVLARPQVAVFSGHTQLAQNAGWSSSLETAALAAAAAQVGAFPFPAGSADAALIINLPPGSYTTQISGADGRSGIALVEIYELP